MVAAQWRKKIYGSYGLQSQPRVSNDYTRVGQTTLFSLLSPLMSGLRHRVLAGALPLSPPDPRPIPIGGIPSDLGPPPLGPPSPRGTPPTPR